MSQVDLLRFLRAKPFLPFQITVSDGTSYEVHHPEMVIASPTSAVIGVPDPAQPGGASDYHLVGIRHIMKLIPLPGAIAG